MMIKKKKFNKKKIRLQIYNIKLLLYKIKKKKVKK